jgi:hypothetical protein
MWIRFPEFYLTDYYYMNTVYWDAVVFVPKRNIVFLGWGIFANYNSKDVTCMVQWQIGEESKSEEYEVELIDSEKDEEKKWFTVDIRDLGQKPIKVSEGTQITVKVKVTNDDNRRCFYGYCGS